MIRTIAAQGKSESRRTMVRTTFVALLFTLSLVLGLPKAFGQDVNRATPEEAMTFVQSLAEQALQTLQLDTISLEARETQFRELLAGGFEMNYIALATLGRHHRQTATPEQIEEYQIYFSEFVLRKYSALLGGYAGEEFVVLSAKPSGKRDMIVKSEIRRSSGPPIATDWRVREFGGEPKIIDIKVEGLSMVSTQREEFASILQRQGMQGLIDVLRARVETLPAEAPA